MKKLIVAILAAFLMAAGLTTVSGGASQASPVLAKTSSKCGTPGYGLCPKAPRPGIKKPRARAHHAGWFRVGNPRHLGGKMRITIVDPQGHKRVITRWTFKKDVSVKIWNLKRGTYRVWVTFTPKGHYRPVYPKYRWWTRG
ncbi:hypothetical protein AB3X52_04065 [Nocardioides sp. DS6]|uniref:Uncharacterized protein n=1 Tax=Nocardioides eburneus TaxID=3231482 RepID=A0ABV3SV19_9ACTN